MLMTDQRETRDVCIVGAGPAGLTAGLFTARAGLDTLVINAGEPILRRNAHLENVPGFPAGVNSRLFLDMLDDQTERNGCDRQEAQVRTVTDADGGHLAVETDEGVIRADYVICTSWADTDYLQLDAVDLTERGSKTYIDVTEDGETGVDGLYAAGRIAGQPHQTVVSAGHGATVALSVVHDSEVPFYHDWVAPEGYFTERGREVPPGCEEIDEAEQQRRERESMAVMQEYFDDPHPDEPTQHPSITEG
jgi:thioredoxin reductase (NADPH)